MANKTIGGCIRTPRPDALFAGIRLNQEPILVEVAHPSIWQLCGTPRARGINSKDLYNLTISNYDICVNGK